MGNDDVVMEALTALRDGTRPPPAMWRTMGLRLEHIEPGRAVVAVEPSAGVHDNATGIVHGGLAATLVDSAAGTAVRSRLGATDGLATVDLGVTYLRRVDVDGALLRCDAEVVHLGRRIATAQARLCDAEGRLIATGRVVFSIAQDVRRTDDGS